MKTSGRLGNGEDRKSGRPLICRRRPGSRMRQVIELDKYGSVFDRAPAVGRHTDTRTASDTRQREKNVGRGGIVGREKIGSEMSERRREMFSVILPKCFMGEEGRRRRKRESLPKQTEEGDYF